MSKIERLQDFYAWMHRIQNIHVANTKAMDRAFEIISNS